MTNKTRIAIIIGAGPAGLTAALELLRRTDIKPIILEASNEIGGISRTVRYKGNRMDIGGHRFFSKSDRVMRWWLEMMPAVDGVGDEATGTEAPVEISYQGSRRTIELPDETREEPPLRGMGPLRRQREDEPCSRRGSTVSLEAELASPTDDLVMLVRPRKSRIYYLRRFFDYPIHLSKNTIENLGPVRIARIGISYIASSVRPIAEEKSLEDYLINRFGRELYLTFFKSYTEKVWGTPCDRISAEWGAQRIKGLSLATALKHFVKKSFGFAPKDTGDLAQKKTDTSLIERFLYPKFGPGQLWEHVADKIVAEGGEIHMGWNAVAVDSHDGVVTAVTAENALGERRAFVGEIFFSTMPMRDLTRALAAGGAVVPDNVREVSEGLEYRDFITVGLLVDKLTVKEKDGGLLKDTWIYVQEPDVMIGRLQIFNNWSPYMVSDPSKVWIGLEYFCYETDALWSMTDDELKSFAAKELETIGILRTNDVLDAHVVRVPKTYPAYFGTYARFDELRRWADGFENLYLVGRNGMHKYNNQDHSMLTAMTVVDGLVAGRVNKEALWQINAEQEYHEEKK